MEERTRISFYKSYSSTFFKLQKKNDQNLYASILFELFFMDIEKIEDFKQKTKEIFKKYGAPNSVELALENAIPNIRKSIERQLNGAKGAPYGKLGGAPKGNKNAQKKQPQNNPYIDMEKEIEIDNEHDIEHEVDFSLKESKISNDDVVEFYGEYKNVALSKKQYQRMLETCGTQDFLDTIIKALDEDISLGRKDEYKENHPQAHFILLNRYCRYRKENPEMFNELKSSEIKNNFLGCSYAKAEEMAIGQAIRDW